MPTAARKTVQTPASRGAAKKVAAQQSPTPAASPTTEAEAPAAGAAVVVRMYNVGFGDCFLVEYPGPEDYVCRILIDCGTIASPATLSMSDVVATLLDDVRDVDGRPRIDIVVCTHRHADHVSGFSRPAWRDLNVKEVWFPWTENPKDDAAKRIRETQSKLALALRSHWQARLATNVDDAQADRWLDLAVNALSNEAAMSMLHTGFKAKPERQYLFSDGSPTVIESDFLGGANAFVLGPAKDESAIRDMDPPVGTTYLRQFAGDQAVDAAFEPFSEDWHIKPAVYQWTNLLVDQVDQAAMQQASQAWNPAVAVALEQAVNGTSLVLAFEIDDVVLFFPGDAQWGTWNALLRNARTAELLKRVQFWKVGHHGSHNATPIDFVERNLMPNCCAMMSTRTGKFASIPRQPLLDAIAAKGIKLARSDEPTKAPAMPFARREGSIVEARLPIGASE